MSDTYATLAAACPPQLKSARPYLQRASEFQQRDPVASYFLGTYAVQAGMECAEDGDTTSKMFLARVLELLDSTKSVASGHDGREALMSTAMKLFNVAEDRTTKRNLFDVTTIKLYFTASQVMEAMLQFGDMDPDLFQRYRYARYTASQMKVALDMGVTYQHAAAGDAEASALEGEGQQQEENGLPPPPAYSSSALPPPPPPPTTSSGVDGDRIALASKHCKFAMSALQFIDRKSAKEQIQKALAALS